MILFINLKANEMAQFSWKRRNGEVVELQNDLNVGKDGLVRNPTKAMRKAIRRKYPTLLKEFDEDLAIREARLSEFLPVSQPLFDFVKTTAKSLFRRRKIT